MAVPKDYNVIDGMIGLGPDILLEVLSEMTSIRDVQQVIPFFAFSALQACLYEYFQFLGVQKKTFGLKDHGRLTKSTESAQK
ncbi:MAG: hypothetical protein EZS28_010569, partial [Streblomastix strix]